jgi:hypothetical protein
MILPLSCSETSRFFSNSFRRAEIFVFGCWILDFGFPIFSARLAIGLTDDFRDLRDLVNAHEGVHFRQQFGQFIAETLRQTAGNDDGLAAIFAARTSADSRMCPRSPPARNQ